MKLVRNKFNFISANDINKIANELEMMKNYIQYFSVENLDKKRI